MGVTGLWKLIESSGKPVPLETLENKILAIGEWNLPVFGISPYKSIVSCRYLHLAASGHQGVPGRQGRHTVKCTFAGIVPPIVQIVVLQNQADFRL